ncbi:MAG: Ig-like domain-containing protein [Patescibacteria group bacterium]
MLKNLAKKISLITAILLVVQMASIGLGVGVKGALAATTFDGTVSNFSLVDTDTNSIVRPIVNGEVINLASFTPALKHITIVANTTPATVGSVVFGLDSNSSYRTENISPYALNGDSSGIYNTWNFIPGFHTLTAIPYELAGGDGAVGTPAAINFSIYDDSTVPTIESVKLDGHIIGIGDTFTINKDFVTANPSNELVLHYSEKMDSSVIPNLAIVPDTSGLITCLPVGWTLLDHEFTFNCTLSSTVFVEIPGLTITASGAKDLAGNIQTPYTSTNQLSVDTKAPALSFSPANGSFVKNQPIAVTATVSENTKAPLIESDFVPTGGAISNFTANVNVYTFNLTPVTEGDLSLSVAAGKYEDLAGNKNIEDKYTLTYDKTAPSPVSGLNITINPSGFPVVSWINPPASTFAGLKIYRDGAFLVTLDPTATTFTDTSAAPGTTYNYEVVTFDAAGNETASLPIKVNTPKIEMPTTTSNLIASSAVSDSGQISAGGAETQNEVKANNDNSNKKDETKKDDNSGLPGWGLFLLLLLAIVGGYLFYTQKPNSQKTNAVPTTPKSTSTKSKSQTSKPRSTPKKK